MNVCVRDERNEWSDEMTLSIYYNIWRAIAGNFQVKFHGDVNM